MSKTGFAVAGAYLVIAKRVPGDMAMRRLLLSLALLKKTKWALSTRSQESRSRGRAKDGRGRRTRRRAARVRGNSRGFILRFYHSGKAEPTKRYQARKVSGDSWLTLIRNGRRIKAPYRINDIRQRR